MWIDIFLVNLPTLAIVTYVVIKLKGKARHKGNLFVAGFVLILASGIASIPYSSWLLSNHSAWLQVSPNLALSSFPIGLLHALGLLFCFSAYNGASPNA